MSQPRQHDMPRSWPQSTFTTGCYVAATAVLRRTMGLNAGTVGALAQDTHIVLFQSHAR